MPPLSLLIKPASGSCNLRCTYCFYADEAQKRQFPTFGFMSDSTMHSLVDFCLREGEGVCTLAFQGGEPTLMGVEFYQRLSRYAAKQPNPRGVQFRYAIQTNGTLLDEAWCRWLAENRVLVGLSLDGPREIHDRYRLDPAGKGTFDRVMAAAKLLEQHGVEFNILTVATGLSARSGQKIANFFRKNGFGYQQFIECLDPLDEAPGGQPYSLTPERYAQFLKATFDAWYQDFQAGKHTYNRYFENLLMVLAGQTPESCSMQGHCAPHLVVEADGSVYPCDFYVLDKWKLGSICTDSLAQLEQQRRALGFLEASLPVPSICRACRWYPLCRNGCRRNRDEATGVNRFCGAYKGFLEYAYPRLAQVYRKLCRRAGRA